MALKNVRNIHLADFVEGQEMGKLDGVIRYKSV